MAAQTLLRGGSGRGGHPGGTLSGREIQIAIRHQQPAQAAGFPGSAACLRAHEETAPGRPLLVKTGKLLVFPRQKVWRGNVNATVRSDAAASLAPR